MTTHFSVLPFLSLISLITWSIAILQYKTALLALGYDLPIMQLFLIIIFLVIAPLIPIPASIGVLELGQYSVFLFLGIDPLVGVALALLVRFRDIIWVMLGLIFSFSYGFSSFKDAIWKTSEKP